MQHVQPYKTAAELEIEEWERDGLIALVGPLSRGELSLEMDTTDDNCGTVACIGGWVAIRRGYNFKGASVYRYVMKRQDHKSLGALYFPDDDFRHPAWNCSAQQAASAIVNFLMLGEPRWDDVMQEAA